MHIIHITSELAPIAKVGGLGDVVYGLSKETLKNKHRVEIILPKYDNIDYKPLSNLKVEFKELQSFEGSDVYKNIVWSAVLENIKIYFIEPCHPKNYFSRGAIYGFPDDSDRFAYFSRAALEFIYKSKSTPDVVHIHDWPTSLVAPLYKDMYIPLGMRLGGILLTIHNLEHQGKCSVEILNQVGLQGSLYQKKDKMQDPILPQLINLLKGGIEYSDLINTVSPTYKNEIQSAPMGFGLEETLIRNQKKLHAILNGIDENFWDPYSDPFLLSNYNTKSTEPVNIDSILEAKSENRRHLRSQLNMEEENAPLVACITRLVPQKGPDLILHAISRTIEKKGQFVLLGSFAGSEYKNAFLEVGKLITKLKKGAICIGINEPLAHQIFAASDMIIIPSLYEPCGLTQMIALRYGCIPIARMTGGLADTVFDVDTSNKREEDRNGYTFEHATKEGIDWALDRAIECWNNSPAKWQKIMINGMKMDFSWIKEAPKYFQLYQLLSQQKGA